MHLNLTGIAFFLVVLFSTQVTTANTSQSVVLGPKCNWTCDTYLAVYLCKEGYDMNECKRLIESGETCCMASKPEESKHNLCVNTSSNHSKVKECLRPFKEEVSCKALSGKILGIEQVMTEFQCMDFCVRDRRCVGFNIFKTTVKPRSCQLLETFSSASGSECNNDYIGKTLDREAFYKAYLDPGCTARAVT